MDANTADSSGKMFNRALMIAPKKSAQSANI